MKSLKRMTVKELGDRLKELVKETEALNKELWSRLPPAERAELKRKIAAERGRRPKGK